MPRPKRNKIVSSQSAAPTSRRAGGRVALKESTASQINSANARHEAKGVKEAKEAEGAIEVRTISAQVDGANENDLAEEDISQRQTRSGRRSVSRVSMNDITQSPAELVSKNNHPQRRSDRASAGSKESVDLSRYEDDSLELSFDTALEGHSPEDAPQRVPNTPSMLSITNFKKRPRQPSILRMVQLSAQKGGYNIDNTEVEGNTSFHSIGEDTTNLSLGDFERQQASPPKSQKRKAIIAIDDDDTLPPRKRKSLEHYANLDLEEEDPHIHQLEPNTKAASPAAVDLGKRATRASAGLSVGSKRRSSNRETLAETANENDDPETPLPTHRSAASRRKSQHKIPSPIVAGDEAPSPVSSSPAPESSQEPRQSNLTAHRRPLPRSQQPRITTAALQTLLPQAKKKARYRHERGGGLQIHEQSSDTSSLEDDGISAADDDDDFDELQRSRPRRLRRPDAAPTASNIKSKSKPSKSGANRVNSRNQSTRRNPADGATKVQQNATATKSKIQRTYGSKSASDRNEDLTDSNGPLDVEAGNQRGTETDDEDDDNDNDIDGGEDFNESSMLEASASEELRQAVKKFEEVDAWDLEFESCDIGASGSSPWR